MAHKKDGNERDADGWSDLREYFDEGEKWQRNEGTAYFGVDVRDELLLTIEQCAPEVLQRLVDEVFPLYRALYEADCKEGRHRDWMMRSSYRGLQLSGKTEAEQAILRALETWAESFHLGEAYWTSKPICWISKPTWVLNRALEFCRLKVMYNASSFPYGSDGPDIFADEDVHQVRKDHRDHFVWLVLYQIKKLSAKDIAEACQRHFLDTLPKAYAERIRRRCAEASYTSISREIRKMATTVGWCLRPSKAGRPKAEKP